MTRQYKDPPDMLPVLPRQIWLHLQALWCILSNRAVTVGNNSRKVDNFQMWITGSFYLKNWRKATWCPVTLFCECWKLGHFPLTCAKIFSGCLHFWHFLPHHLLCALQGREHWYLVWYLSASLIYSMTPTRHEPDGLNPPTLVGYFLGRVNPWTN